MKYLIAIDSDGTLRHSDGNISDKTKETIKKVIDCGNIVVICTARPRYYTLKISNEVGINEYLISSNKICESFLVNIVTYSVFSDTNITLRPSFFVSRYIILHSFFGK